MEHVAVNRKDEERKFFQADRAQVRAEINYKHKDTHQRIIPKEVINKTEIISPAGCASSLILI